MPSATATAGASTSNCQPLAPSRFQNGPEGSNTTPLTATPNSHIFRSVGEPATTGRSGSSNRCCCGRIGTGSWLLGKSPAMCPGIPLEVSTRFAPPPPRGTPTAPRPTRAAAPPSCAASVVPARPSPAPANHFRRDMPMTVSPVRVFRLVIVKLRRPSRILPHLEQELSTMRIVRIFAHRVQLPLHEGSYKWSGGKSVSVFDSTIVGVETDSGLIGYGEVCPLGPFYLPAYAEGVRAGLKELGPHLTGARSSRAGRAQSSHGRGAQGASVRQGGHRHRLLGHSRADDGLTGLRADGRPVWRQRAALSRHLPGVAGRDGRESRRAIGPKATRGFSSRSAAIPIRTSSALARCAPAATDRSSRCRRQYRLDAARSDARVVARRARSWTSISSSRA